MTKTTDWMEFDTSYPNKNFRFKIDVPVNFIGCRLSISSWNQEIVFQLTDWNRLFHLSAENDYNISFNFIGRVNNNGIWIFRQTLMYFHYLTVTLEREPINYNFLLVLLIQVIFRWILCKTHYFTTKYIGGTLFFHA